MRKLIPFITCVALALIMACAKTESPTTASAAAAPAAKQPAQSTAPSSEQTPADASPVAGATEAPAAEPAASETTVAEAPASANLPPPLLPRRGEATSIQEPENPASPAASANRITIADAREILQAGNGVLVDVRNADAYEFQRIAGAVNIPLGEIADRASELPQDKWIITYCTCPAEESSGAAASTLSNMGFERVAALLGGMRAWRDENLPLEFGER